MSFSTKRLFVTGRVSLTSYLFRLHTNRWQEGNPLERSGLGAGLCNVFAPLKPDPFLSSLCIHNRSMTHFITHSEMSNGFSTIGLSFCCKFILLSHVNII